MEGRHGVTFSPPSLGLGYKTDVISTPGTEQSSSSNTQSLLTNEGLSTRASPYHHV